MTQVGLVTQQPQYNSAKAKADFEKFNREKTLEAKQTTTGLNKEEKMELALLKASNLITKALDKDAYIKS